MKPRLTEHVKGKGCSRAAVIAGFSTDRGSRAPFRVRLYCAERLEPEGRLPESLSFPSCKMGPGAAPPSRRVFNGNQTLARTDGRLTISGSGQVARTPLPRMPLAGPWRDSISQGTLRRTGAWRTGTPGPVLRAVGGGGGTMDSPEVTFTLAYLVFAVCFVFTPTEFHSAGLTVQNLLSGWLGSEDAAFVPYHQRRTAATLFCHSLLPLGEAPALPAGVPLSARRKWSARPGLAVELWGPRGGRVAGLLSLGKSRRRVLGFPVSPRAEAAGQPPMCSLLAAAGRL